VEGTASLYRAEGLEATPQTAQERQRNAADTS